MANHPYQSLHEKAFWRRSVAAVNPECVDPVGVFDLSLSKDMKVATAGSCFAQHIARHLQNSGFNYFVAEEGHPLLSLTVKTKNNYGLFSARYGNIYTSRQLIQLFQRAYGFFKPEEIPWVCADGKIFDPFRPNVQPGGFVSVEAMLIDRDQHLESVRVMFETLDVFVFTLGLTECWRSKADGAVFPLCPGVEGGTFSEDCYEFYNQTVEDVFNDMSTFVEALASVNSRANVILTVSPVPLMATADPGSHVLAATTYSKSVLRVAAEQLRQKFSNVHYFPSYEIITGSFNRGRYYAEDLRNVLEEGVGHVMRLFLKHAAGLQDVSVVPQHEKALESNATNLAQAIVDVECDETALDR